MVKMMFFEQKTAFSTKLSEDKDDNFNTEENNETGVLVEDSKPEIKEPSLYQVVLLNDDYTPMDFVVMVLVNFFSKNQVQATQVMLQVHHEGKGICGKFTCEIAETKVMQVNNFAKENNHPLIAVMEQANN